MNKTVLTSVSIFAFIIIMLAVVFGLIFGRMRIELLQNAENNPPQQDGTVLEIDEHAQTREFTYGKSETVVLKTSFSLPHVQGDSDAAQIINQYYENIYQKKVAYCEDELYNFAVDSIDYIESWGYFYSDETFEVKLNQDGFLSIVRSGSEYTGGVHGNWFVFCDTFNSQTGAKLSLSDLFSVPYEQYSQIIFSEVKRQIAQSDTTDGYYENYSELIDSAFSPDDFFLSEDGINVVFQMYAIAPYAAGEQFFTISPDAFGDMLKPEILSVFSNSISPEHTE